MTQIWYKSSCILRTITLYSVCTFLQPPTPLLVYPEPVAVQETTTTTDDSEKALLVCSTIIVGLR